VVSSYWLTRGTLDKAVTRGWLPGRTAKEWGHPQAQAVMVAGWTTPLGGFAFGRSR
jgi:hypothetical protein